MNEVTLTTRRGKVTFKGGMILMDNDERRTRHGIPRRLEIISIDPDLMTARVRSLNTGGGRRTRINLHRVAEKWNHANGYSLG